MEGEYLRRRFQLYPYQILRWYADLTGLELTLDAKEALFKDVLSFFVSIRPCYSFTHDDAE